MEAGRFRTGLCANREENDNNYRTRSGFLLDVLFLLDPGERSAARTSTLQNDGGK